MTDSPTILIATTNPGKFRELRSVLEDLPALLIGLDAYPGLPEAVEDGETFEDNARIKALHYARLTHDWVLADDSGLEVDFLGLEPGVRSARYAGPQCDDRANNAKLIAALAGIPLEKRTARFRCVMALAAADRVVAVAEGSVEGHIVDQPAGDNGFGYDPHFFVPRFHKTTAQMSPELKNRISHRGQAARAIRTHLERLIAGVNNPPARGKSF